jgi:hypothetical protein
MLQNECRYKTVHVTKRYMLQNVMLQNGTLQNSTVTKHRHKTVRVTKRYVTKRCVTKRYVLQNGTLRRVSNRKRYFGKILHVFKFEKCWLPCVYSTFVQGRVFHFVWAYTTVQWCHFENMTPVDYLNVVVGLAEH